MVYESTCGKSGKLQPVLDVLVSQHRFDVPVYVDVTELVVSRPGAPPMEVVGQKCQGSRKILESTCTCREPFKDFQQIFLCI